MTLSELLSVAYGGLKILRVAPTLNSPNQGNYFFLCKAFITNSFHHLV